jgi:hypothetical protein
MTTACLMQTAAMPLTDSSDTASRLMMLLVSLERNCTTADNILQYIMKHSFRVHDTVQ